MELNSENIKDFFNKREIFDCEFSFQFELAWWLKNSKNKEIEKIKFEDKKCYEGHLSNIKEHRTPRCDLVIYEKNGQKTLIELKYIRQNETTTTSVSARKSFVKDFSRLKKCVNETKNSCGYCIFLTNWDTILDAKQYKEDENEVLLNFKNNFANKKWQEYKLLKDSDENEDENKNFSILVANVRDDIYNNVMPYNEVMEKY